jgi:ketosteroid isomerase-like protein
VVALVGRHRLDRGPEHDAAEVEDDRSEVHGPEGSGEARRITTPPRSPAPEDPILDATIQIRALLHAYAARLDDGDLDGVAALFADATFRSPAGTHLSGTAEVRRMYDAVHLYDGRPLTRHLISGAVIDVADDAATARSTCQFVVVQATGGSPFQPVLAGRYVDEFDRGPDGRWRFRDRLVISDLTGDLSRHYALGSTATQSPS